MVEEFNLEFLHTLVDEALIEPHSTSPLSHTDILMLEKLYDLLISNNISAEIRAIIFKELKQTLLVGNPKTDIKSLHTKTINCHKCDKATSRAALPLGNIIDPKILFIAINSSWDDNLIKYLDQVSLPRQDCSYTYLTRCRLAEVNEAEINNCIPYLFEEIDLLRPLVIVPVGSLPTKYILSSDLKVTEEHGSSFWLGIHHVVPILDPTYAEKSDKIGTLIEDLNRIKAIVYA